MRGERFRTMAAALAMVLVLASGGQAFAMLTDTTVDAQNNIYGSQVYTDVTEGSWADEAIGVVANAGLMQGDDEGDFNPQEPVDAGTMDGVADYFADLLATKTTDETAGEDAQAQAQTELKQQLTQGLDCLTRKGVAQLAARVAEAYGYQFQTDTTLLDKFADSSGLTEEDKIGLALALECGILSGKVNMNTGAYLLDADGVCTNEQTAAILSRLLLLIERLETEAQGS